MDIVEIERIRRLAGCYGDRFFDRVFHPSEAAYCTGREKWERMAARFAAKEAVLKAVGTGLRRCRWRDIEVTRDSLGRPEIRLTGHLAEEARRRGIERVLVTLTHARDYAVAQALALGGEG